MMLNIELMSLHMFKGLNVLRREVLQSFKALLKQEGLKVCWDADSSFLIATSLTRCLFIIYCVFRRQHAEFVWQFQKKNLFSIPTKFWPLLVLSGL